VFCILLYSWISLFALCTVHYLVLVTKWNEMDGAGGTYKEDEKYIYIYIQF
jgi:hypothetical protein